MVTDTYTYDGDGVRRTHTVSATTTTYLNNRRTVEVGAVEWNAKLDTSSDSLSELYFLRARYYDPVTGRFLGHDPLELAQRYAYVGNNPVRFTDPSGLCKWGMPCPAPARWVGDRVGDVGEVTVAAGSAVVGAGARAVEATAGSATALAGAAVDFASRFNHGACLSAGLAATGYGLSFTGVGAIVAPVFFAGAVIVDVRDVRTEVKRPTDRVVRTANEGTRDNLEVVLAASAAGADVVGKITGTAGFAPPGSIRTVGRAAGGVGVAFSASLCLRKAFG